MGHDPQHGGGGGRHNHHWKQEANPKRRKLQPKNCSIDNDVSIDFFKLLKCLKFKPIFLGSLSFFPNPREAPSNRGSIPSTRLSVHCDFESLWPHSEGFALPSSKSERKIFIAPCPRSSVELPVQPLLLGRSALLCPQ